MKCLYVSVISLQVWQINANIPSGFFQITFTTFHTNNLLYIKWKKIREDKKMEIFAFALFIATSHAIVHGWVDCGSNLATIKYVRIEGCSVTPCRFVRGNTYIIEVDACARGYTETLRFLTTTRILGIDITLKEGDACDFLSAGRCPVNYGSCFTFRVEYPVPTLLPALNTTVNTSLWTDLNLLGVCINVGVNLI